MKTSYSTRKLTKPCLQIWFSTRFVIALRDSLKDNSVPYQSIMTLSTDYILYRHQSALMLIEGEWISFSPGEKIMANFKIINKSINAFPDRKSPGLFLPIKSTAQLNGSKFYEIKDFFMYMYIKQIRFLYKTRLYSFLATVMSVMHIYMYNRYVVYIMQFIFIYFQNRTEHFIAQ